MRNKCILFFAFAALIPLLVSIAQSTPELDELSLTKLKLLNSRSALVSTQEQLVQTMRSQVQEDTQKFVIEIETKYPGYTINFQNGVLIKKPPAPTVPSKEQEKK